MRRSAIRTGAKSVKRGSTFKARTRELARRSGPSRKARKIAVRAELRELRASLIEAWADGVAAARCVVSGRSPADGWKIDGHHVCEAAWIKDAAARRGYTPEQLIRALWDTRNRLPVEHLTHLAHHAYSRQGRARIPRAVVLRHCPQILDFAAEHGLLGRFDAAYPDTTNERS